LIVARDLDHDFVPDLPLAEIQHKDMGVSAEDCLFAIYRDTWIPLFYVLLDFDTVHQLLPLSGQINDDMSFMVDPEKLYHGETTIIKYMDNIDSVIGSSVYNFIELVGTSSKGWEEAVSNAIDSADGKLTNMRIAEVVEMDTKLVEGKIVQFRAKVRLSFKHEVEPETL
jgi:flavin-binding protein dodecin